MKAQLIMFLCYFILCIKSGKLLHQKHEIAMAFSDIYFELLPVTFEVFEACNSFMQHHFENLVLCQL